MVFFREDVGSYIEALRRFDKIRKILGHAALGMCDEVAQATTVLEAFRAYRNCCENIAIDIWHDRESYPAVLPEFCILTTTCRHTTCTGNTTIGVSDYGVWLERAEDADRLDGWGRDAILIALAGLKPDSKAVAGDSPCVYAAAVLQSEFPEVVEECRRNWERVDDPDCAVKEAFIDGLFGTKFLVSGWSYYPEHNMNTFKWVFSGANTPGYWVAPMNIEDYWADQGGLMVVCDGAGSACDGSMLNFAPNTPEWMLERLKQSPYFVHDRSIRNG